MHRGSDVSAKLSTGGQDVRSQTAPDEYASAMLPQALGKGIDGLRGGWRKRASGNRIAGDEIDLDAQFAEQGVEHVCVFRVVVHSAEHDVFDDDAFPARQRVSFEGMEEVLQRPLSYPGHQEIPEFLVGGVQGNGRQSHPAGAKPFQRVRDPNCGDQDLSPGNAGRLGEMKKACVQGFLVEERFAHSHKNNACWPHSRGLFKLMRDGTQLTQDF